MKEVKFFKGCPPQILLGLLLNTFSQMYFVKVYTAEELWNVFLFVCLFFLNRKIILSFYQSHVYSIKN